MSDLVERDCFARIVDGAGASNTESRAVFSTDGHHRLSLSRRWSTLRDCRYLNFLMLNPSTADECVNDPTVARCESRARREGYGGLLISNLFSLRSTDPLGLRKTPKPNHPRNDSFVLLNAMRSERTICAWGSHAMIRSIVAPRAAHVLSILRAREIRLHVLKLTKDGHPWHPLYLPDSLDAKPWT